MKTKQFEVPVELIHDFSEVLGDNDLTNCIDGVNEEGEILINVEYEKEERAAIYELNDLLEDFYEDDDENEEEEEDED